MTRFFPPELPEILFWGDDSYICQASHIHSFFQLEICTAGILQVFLGREKQCRLLKPYDCCLIPPETPHYFGKCSDEVRFVSIKFEFKQCDFQYLNNDITKELSRRLVTELETNNSVLGDRLSQYTLYNLLHELYTAQPLPPELSPLLRKINSIILQMGYGVNVKQLAEYMDCSVQQLQYQYRLHNNTAYGNLKTYLDAVIIDNAENHLRYSALSISEIAEALKFPDVYTFSRFFKHRTGIPPSIYRKEFLSSGCEE